MRIKINFSGNSEFISIPIDYSHYLQSFIYSNLPESISKFIHNEGFMTDNKKFRLFTFSNIFSNYYKVEGKYIKYKNNAYFYFSCPIKDIVEIFANSIFSKTDKKLRIFNTDININSIDVIRTPQIVNEPIIIKTLSPITIKKTIYDNDKKKEKNILPDDKDFINLILSNLSSKHKVLTNKDLSVNDIELKVLKYKKTLKKYKNNIIDSIKGLLLMKTDQEIFNTMYHCGLGSRNSQGFGMIEVERYF